MEKIVRAVAEVVCNHMGGFEVNSTDRCDHHRQELHLFELKRELGTNVIPLGHIRVGRFLERAMLFKVLADRIGLPCSLVRGEYQRAWVEIAIPESAYEEKLAFPSTIPRKSSSLLTTDSGRILHHIATQWLPQPEPEPEPEEVVTCNKQFVPGYMVKPNRVVDLMWEIGSLYPLKTYKAVQYCNIPEVDRPSVTSTQMFNIT
ncbi:hypothetical protein C0J52_04013 [Blattella germanica]|nr:hypothetical protein C0J52_04013 [Blattella germanica]